MVAWFSRNRDVPEVRGLIPEALPDFLDGGMRLMQALVAVDAPKDVTDALLSHALTVNPWMAVEIEQVEIGIKYAGYIDRQKSEVERAAAYENLTLPEDFDYMQVPALSIEVRQKLNRHKPSTLGQASRISGITPAAISLLLIHLKKSRKDFGQTAAQKGEA